MYEKVKYKEGKAKRKIGRGEKMEEGNKGKKATVRCTWKDKAVIEDYPAYKIQTTASSCESLRIQYFK